MSWTRKAEFSATDPNAAAPHVASASPPSPSSSAFLPPPGALLTAGGDALRWCGELTTVTFRSGRWVGSPLDSSTTWTGEGEPESRRAWVVTGQDPGERSEAPYPHPRGELSALTAQLVAGGSGTRSSLPKAV